VAALRYVLSGANRRRAAAMESECETTAMAAESAVHDLKTQMRIHWRFSRRS
jgi:hypothetical protein